MLKRRDLTASGNITPRSVCSARSNLPALHYNYPMKLTIEEVEHIASLARLELTEEELQRFRGQLSDILEYAARLQQLDTQGIPPTSSVLPPRTVLRPDQPATFLDIPELLDNAPRREGRQYRVPPVMEEPE